MKKGWQEQSRANQCPGLLQLQALLKQKALWIAQKAEEEKLCCPIPRLLRTKDLLCNAWLRTDVYFHMRKGEIIYSKSVLLPSEPPSLPSTTPPLGASPSPCTLWATAAAFLPRVSNSCCLRAYPRPAGTHRQLCRTWRWRREHHTPAAGLPPGRQPQPAWWTLSRSLCTLCSQKRRVRGDRGKGLQWNHVIELVRA